MKRFNKTIAVLCSATMILGSSITAFADAPTSSGGAGNVLAYNYDTVIVPTAIKITFNPQGLSVKTGDGENDKSTEKIVSLNYGIASKASTDKKVVVKFAANFVQNGEDEIEVDFVDAAAKATAKSTQNATGAGNGEHKIYLYVAPATEAPKLADETDFEIDDEADVRDNATAENLANVKMTAAAEAKGVVFGKAASDAKNDAYANVGFKLGAAEYDLKDDATVDFDTTLSGLADKLEIKELGDVTGFTFKGTMNENTDWSEANISAINITPIYTVAAAGTEVAVEDTQCVVTLEETADTAEPDKPAAGGTGTQTDDYKMTASNGGYTYTFVSAPTGSLTDIKVNGTSKQKAITNNLVTYSDGVLTLTATFVTNNSVTTSTEIKVTIGGTDYTMVLQ